MRTLFPKLVIAALCLAGAQAFAKPTDDSYALVRDGQRTTFVGSHSNDDTEVDTLRKTTPGSFVWFRQSGKAYIVRDPATLDKIAAAWAPADKLGQEMKKLGAEMRGHGTAMAALSREMTAPAPGATGGRRGSEETGKKMEALGKTMDALGKEMDKLGKQMERESKQADATSRTVLQSALASGAAQAITR
jgi:hypothetical protein